MTGVLKGIRGRLIFMEQGKPSLPLRLPKLARAFDVSIDYFLIEEAKRCPLKIKKDEFSEDYRKLKDLGEEDRKSVLKIIDSLYTKAKIAELTA